MAIIQISGLSIMQHLRVCYELSMWPAPSCIDSSAGGSLHQHDGEHGLECFSSLIFFPFPFCGLQGEFIWLMINCDDCSL